MQDPLLSISPIDGRYSSKLSALSDFFSEFALYKYRLKVELNWFIYLCNSLGLKGTRQLSPAEITSLKELGDYFDVVAARSVKDLEKETNHDVKALEYYIKEFLSATSMADLTEYIHFGCTSEDINNVAHALMMKSGYEYILTTDLQKLIDQIHDFANMHKAVPMLSLTHGQPASPTTLGKEMMVYAARVKKQTRKLSSVDFTAKWNGAVGNYNAHNIVDSKVDWIHVSKDFLGSLELAPNLYTTQIEPHDNIVEFMHALHHLNTVLIGFAQNMWQYISREIFIQSTLQGEIGSSTMPHKVNPIDFENAEGNLGLANALASFFCDKLPISRHQRDLSDSTVLRNLGTIFGHSQLAYQSLQRGLSKLSVDRSTLDDELESHPEVLAEAIQTVARVHGVKNPYELLKQETRGKQISLNSLRGIIKKMDLSNTDKARLLKLKPSSYTGLAEELVKHYFKENK